MVFKNYHESAVGVHVGVFKTTSMIKSVSVWPKVDADIRAFQDCALSKPALNSKMDLLASKVPSSPMQRLYLDFIGKLPMSRASNAFTLVEVGWFLQVYLDFSVEVSHHHTSSQTESALALCLNYIFPH